MHTASREATRVTGPAPSIIAHYCFPDGGRSSPPTCGRDSKLLNSMTGTDQAESAIAFSSVSELVLNSSSVAQPKPGIESEQSHSEPPRVLEVPPPQVFQSPFPFIASLVAICTASAAIYLARSDDHQQSKDSCRPVCLVSAPQRDASKLKVIAHVDWPLFDPLRVYSLLCISAAILMHSPTPQSVGIGCITPLFERHELILYDTLRSDREYLPLMSISGSRTGPAGDNVLSEVSADSRPCTVHSNSLHASPPDQNSGCEGCSVRGKSSELSSD